MELMSEILVVDDNPTSLRMLAQLLTRHHYKVRAVLDGSQVLTALDANPPDLILLDLMMPGIDGYEVCERVKAHPEGQNIPVIFISALSSAQDKVRAFQMGGVDYITKPFDIEEVIARMENHLKLHRLQKQHHVDHHELDVRLAEFDKLNRELQQRNEDLAAYDGRVSHDLKAPISYICTTTEWLQRSYTQLTSEQLHHFLGQIATRAYQANSIIESLLLLAQKGDIDLYPVDMDALAKRSVHTLHDLMTDRDARLNFTGTLPPALGQTSLVEQVWDNYLSNAIKYGGQPPYISIGASEQPDGMVQFWVRDNGPGIPSERQHDIFGSTAHVEDASAEGHGLGLSIVRRIIHRLGGEVGFENLPETGCNFYFTLRQVNHNK